MHAFTFHPTLSKYFEIMHASACACALYKQDRKSRHFNSLFLFLFLKLSDLSSEDLFLLNVLKPKIESIHLLEVLAQIHSLDN